MENKWRIKYWSKGKDREVEKEASTWKYDCTSNPRSRSECFTDLQ
jgi:hypothetical protein